MLIVVVWVVIAFVIGGAGQNKTCGFWSPFVCSLLLTPIVGIIIVATSKDPIPPVVIKGCPYCGFEGANTTGFCEGCGKDEKGITREEYKAKAAGIE